MKRTLIKLGASSLVVSLPPRWTSKYSLKQGATIELEEHHNTLLLRPGTSVPIRKTSIDLSGLPGLYKRIVASAYLSGSDEITVTYKAPELGRILTARVRDMISMEVIAQEKGRLVIKDISGSSSTDIEPLLRRVFHMVQTVLDEASRALEHPRNLEYLQDMESGINRITDHCMRLLIKYGYNEPAKTPIMYAFVLLLEQVADECKQITNYCIDYKIGLTQAQQRFFVSIKELFEAQQELFYSFSHESAARLAKQRDVLVRGITKHLTLCRSVSESQVWRSLKELSEAIIRLLSQSLSLAALGSRVG